MKKKLLIFTLAFSMVFPLTGCQSITNRSNGNSTKSITREVEDNSDTTKKDSYTTTQSDVSNDNEKTETNNQEIGNQETSNQETNNTTEKTSFTNDEIKTLLKSVVEKMDTDKNIAVDSYIVDKDNNSVAKAMTLQVSAKENGPTYFKMASPIMQLEMYANEKESEYTYLDISIDKDSLTTSDVSEEDVANAYFDGQRYHMLTKAKVSNKDAQSNGSSFAFTDTTSDAVTFDDSTEFVVYDQKQVNGYTVVGVAYTSEEDDLTNSSPKIQKEQHLVLYLKDNNIDKIIVSGDAVSTSEDTDELSATLGVEKTESYSLLNFNASYPNSIPSYLENAEENTEEEFTMNAAMSIFAISFSMMGLEDENGETVKPAGEWSPNAGELSMEDVQIIRDTINLDTFYILNN